MDDGLANNFHNKQTKLNKVTFQQSNIGWAKHHLSTQASLYLL